MSSTGIGGVAGGDIFPCRFVSPSPSADFAYVQATANSPILGISQVGTNKAPIPDVVSDKAATAGQSLRIHSNTEACLLELGGTVQPGDRLKADADGKGVSIATSGTVPQRTGAIAREGGSVGNMIHVVVAIGSESPA